MHYPSSSLTLATGSFHLSLKGWWFRKKRFFLNKFITHDPLLCLLKLTVLDISQLPQNGVTNTYAGTAVWR